MGKLVQVRDVPEPVHRTLKARAAQSGISLSEYLRAELALIAARPTPDEVRERLRNLPPGVVGPARERPAAIIRRLRDAAD
jgi:plasmid stability protein